MDTETKLVAFHGDHKLKERYVFRVHAHALADEIVHGKYWEGGKGCAVGCTIHSGAHSKYETELGIPQILARLEDRIFEGSSNEWSMKWPERFLTAIPVGADLSKIWAKFAVWLLVDEEFGVVRHAKSEKSTAAIRAVASAYERDDVKREEWLELRRNCNAYDAYAADADADAYAYAYAYDAYAAAADAYAADAYAAAADAYAAYSYLDPIAAAHAVAAEYYDGVVHKTVRQQSFERQGEKLLQLMSEAPVL